MKRKSLWIFMVIIVLTAAVLLGACETKLSDTTFKKNGVTFTALNSDVLSDEADDRSFVLCMGNMIMYDSLFYVDNSEELSEILDSEDYQDKTKVCVSFKAVNTPDAIRELESSYLYSDGNVYEPYHLLYYSNEGEGLAVMLFEGGLDISDNPVFALRNDKTIVVCGENEAAEAVEADLSSHQINTYSEAYSQSESYDDADEIFESGNTYYKDGNYEKAECYYLMALNDTYYMSDYKEEDVRNNLVLTRLQLEKNEYALRMASELVKNNPVADADDDDEKKDAYGYIINLLVAAHANELTAEKAFSDCSTVSLSDIEKDLTKLADDDPGEFVRFMTALVYNEQYMAMEQTNDKAEFKKISETLDKLNKQEKKTFDAYDEDINELKTYLSAKIDTLDTKATQDSETTKATESTEAASAKATEKAASAAD